MHHKLLDQVQTRPAPCVAVVYSADQAVIRHISKPRRGAVRLEIRRVEAYMHILTHQFLRTRSACDGSFHAVANRLPRHRKVSHALSSFRFDFEVGVFFVKRWAGEVQP